MLTSDYADFDAHEYERRLARLREILCPATVWTPC